MVTVEGPGVDMVDFMFSASHTQQLKQKVTVKVWPS